MKKVSERFPDVVFELLGDGEDSLDLWKAYFLNGRMQFCRGDVVYDKFNENELQD